MTTFVRGKTIASGATMASILLAAGLPWISGPATAAGVQDNTRSTGGAAATPGRVVTWGTWPDPDEDAPVEAMSGVTSVASGGGFYLALRDGKVIAWGDGGWQKCP